MDALDALDALDAAAEDAAEKEDARRRMRRRRKRIWEPALRHIRVQRDAPVAEAADWTHHREHRVLWDKREDVGSVQRQIKEQSFDTRIERCHTNTKLP